MFLSIHFYLHLYLKVNIDPIYVYCLYIFAISILSICKPLLGGKPGKIIKNDVNQKTTLVGHLGEFWIGFNNFKSFLAI